MIHIVAYRQEMARFYAEEELRLSKKDWRWLTMPEQAQALNNAEVYIVTALRYIPSFEAADRRYLIERILATRRDVKIKRVILP